MRTETEATQPGLHLPISTTTLLGPQELIDSGIFLSQASTEYSSWHAAGGFTQLCVLTQISRRSCSQEQAKTYSRAAQG